MSRGCGGCACDDVEHSQQIKHWLAVERAAHYHLSSSRHPLTYYHLFFTNLKMSSISDVLETMLSEGRLSRNDFERLQDCLRRERHYIVMHGNVTLQCRMPTYLVELTHNVFNTAELLENILQYLSPTLQLQSRAVCKGFQRAIDQSPNIRRNMHRQETLNSATSAVTLAPYRIQGIRSKRTQVRGIRGGCLEIDRTSYIYIYY